MTTRLKICGITRSVDLEVCSALGVDAVGINLWSGSRRGLSVDEARATLGGNDMTPGAKPQRVGVFVEPTVEEVRRAIGELALDAIQLHDDRDPAPFQELGAPWIRVVRGTPDLGELDRAGPTDPRGPSWVLLDARVSGFGGAGRRTDWAWAAQAVQRLAPRPVWLAGGLTPDNAAAAIAAVHPAGLDVASGAEKPGATHGEKDAQRIEALVRACRAAPG